MTNNNDHIQKALEQDASRITERMPESCTPENITRLGKSLRQFMISNDLTAVRVGELIGYSSSVVGSFTRGNYTGDVQGVANKVVNLINSYDRKSRRSQKEPYIETTVARKIKTIITQTEAFGDQEGRIGLIIGDGGHGKTHCLKAYNQANRNSLYVEIDETMASKAIFAEIAKRMGVEANGSLSAIAGRLAGALRILQTIVMIDEASSLTVKQLNQLRQIIVVKGQCPLILAGNADLLKTVFQSDTRRGYRSLDQFTSRIMAILNLDEICGNNDGDDLYTAEDVRRLYEYGGIRLTPDAVDTLKRMCRTPNSGRLRTCNHIIAALHTAKPIIEKGIIDTAAILAAIDQLKLPAQRWLPIVLQGVTGRIETGQSSALAG